MEGCRAQSSVIGVVLLLGLVIAATSLVVFIGSTAITDSKDRINRKQAQLELSSVTSDIVEVSASGNIVRSVQLSSADGATVDPDAGNIRLVFEKGGTKTVLYNQSLGALRISSESGTIASQGGGVWSKSGANGSVMVSPPEVTYRKRTLTMPVVRLTGSESVASSFTIERQSERVVFPNETYHNPLRKGQVYLDIESEFYRAWGRYFESRTEGAVTYFPAEDRVRVQLVVPITETFDNAIETTDSNGISKKKNGVINGGTREGVAHASVSSAIESRIESCDSGACPDLTNELGATNTVGNGTYYEDGDVSLGTSGVTFDTSSGNIQVVVNGTVTFKGTGGPGNEDITITGPGVVRLYVKGVSATGNPAINSDGNASNLLTLVHSNASKVFAGGTPQYTGLLYAPDSKFAISGGGKCGNGKGGGGKGKKKKGKKGGGAKSCDSNVNGSIVVESADIGNGVVKQNSNIDFRMDVVVNSSITYLHVSESVVEVES